MEDGYQQMPINMDNYFDDLSQELEAVWTMLERGRINGLVTDDNF